MGSVLGGPPPAGHEFTAIAPLATQHRLRGAQTGVVAAVALVTGLVAGQAGRAAGGPIAGAFAGALVGGLFGGIAAAILAALGGTSSGPPDRPKRSRADQQTLQAAQRQIGIRDHMVWAVNRHNLLVLECPSWDSRRPRQLRARIARRDVSVEAAGDRWLAVRIKGVPLDVWGAPVDVRAIAAALGSAEGATVGTSASGGGSSADTSSSRRTGAFVAIGLVVVAAVLAGVVLLTRSPDASTVAATASTGASTTTVLATTSTVPHVTTDALGHLCTDQRPSALSAPYVPGPGAHPAKIWENSGYAGLKDYSLNPKLQVSEFAKGPELDAVQLVVCINQHPVEPERECGPYEPGHVMAVVQSEVVDVSVYAASTGSVVAQQTLTVLGAESCPATVTRCPTCTQATVPPHPSGQLEKLIAPLVQTP